LFSEDYAMGKILCATRGGEASYGNQGAAVALAQERGDELVFVHVVDVGFLSRMAHVVQPDGMAAHMAKMGKVFLELAQARASDHGFAADCILRHGGLFSELVATVKEQNATTVVLGNPAGAASVFALSSGVSSEPTAPKGRQAALENLRAFVAEVESETGVRVHIP
jgi:nucleotide-binding universal stress UspA family protein